MSLNLRQIEVFRAIMMTGSISGAARLLSVSQPAISRLLAYTEDRLGLRLFERIKGRVQPTPEARKIYAEVDHIHQGIRRVNELTEELRRGGTGSVRIASSPSIAQFIVPQAVAAFRKRYPDVRLELEILTISEVIAKVGSNRVDLGFAIVPVEEPTVFATTLAEGRLMVVCPKQHQLAQLPAIRAEDLAEHAMIGFGAHTPYGAIVDRALAGAEKPVRYDTLVRFPPNACALVQAGAGIAIVDSFVVMGRTWPDIVARPLVPATPMRLQLLVSRAEPLSLAAKAFIAGIREELAALPADQRVMT